MDSRCGLKGGSEIEKRWGKTLEQTDNTLFEYSCKHFSFSTNGAGMLEEPKRREIK